MTHLLAPPSHTRRVAKACFTASVITALVAAPAQADHDIYQHVSAGTQGEGQDPVRFGAVSADGRVVFFDAREPIVLADMDDSRDVYKRVGGRTTLLSLGSINGNGPHVCLFVGASADGQRAFFRTTERLVPADGDMSEDVYERMGTTTKLVSAGQINGNGAFPVTKALLSADGTRAFFETNEKLVSADTDNTSDVYERSGGVTTLVSNGQINGNGAFDARISATSSDGSRVWFQTDERLVNADTGPFFDVYEHSNGTTFLVSRSAVIGSNPDNAWYEGRSSDSSHIFFRTGRQLVAGDLDGGADDVYAFHGGVVEQVSVGQIEDNSGAGALYAASSADGNTAFFTTREKMVAADTDDSVDLYVRSAGTTYRVSGGQINGNLAHNVFFKGSSANGSHVFFETAERLVAADADGESDVYERFGSATTLVSRSDLGGTVEEPAYFAGASTDGTRVFFVTYEKLVASDTDPQSDIYERADGSLTKVSPGNGASNAGWRGATQKGLAIYFETHEALLPSDSDHVSDLYGAYALP